jgi:hypothetical protein
MSIERNRTAPMPLTLPSPATMNNTARLSFGQLDPSDQHQLVDYERAFYSSFVKVESNRLVRKLWQWNSSDQRLATRIPYTDQIMYVLRTEQGKIDTGLGVNIALKEFQSSTFDFPPPATAIGSCEILTFFSAVDRQAAVKIKFWKRCCWELLHLGFHTAYATCAPHPLATFRRMGGKILAEATIQNERRFFLEFALKEIGQRAELVSG